MNNSSDRVALSYGQKRIFPGPTWARGPMRNERVIQGKKNMYFFWNASKTIWILRLVFCDDEKSLVKFCMQRCLNSTIVRPSLLLSCLVRPLFRLHACFWNIYNLSCINDFSLSIYKLIQTLNYNFPKSNETMSYNFRIKHFVIAR